MTNTLGTIRNGYQVGKDQAKTRSCGAPWTRPLITILQALLDLSILLSMFGFIFFVVIVGALSGIVISSFIQNAVATFVQY